MQLQHDHYRLIYISVSIDRYFGITAAPDSFRLFPIDGAIPPWFCCILAVLRRGFSGSRRKSVVVRRCSLCRIESYSSSKTRNSNFKFKTIKFCELPEHTARRNRSCCCNGAKPVRCFRCRLDPAFQRRCSKASGFGMDRKPTCYQGTMCIRIACIESLGRYTRCICRLWFGRGLLNIIRICKNNIWMNEYSRIERSNLR